MRLYCTLIDKCGWYEEANEDEQFLCPECGSLALPWINNRLEEDGTTVPIIHHANNRQDPWLEQHSADKSREDTDTPNKA